jgi:hypothetical protein
MSEQTIPEISDLLDNSQDHPESISRHHRKLESRGGNNSPRNISCVPLFKHRAWHVLYKNMEPSAIITQFEEDYEVYETDYIKTPLMKKLHEGWANNTDEKIKRTRAWYTLFEDMTLEEIVGEINRVWLDPDYEILIGIKRVKTIQLRVPQTK